MKKFLHAISFGAFTGLILQCVMLTATTGLCADTTDTIISPQSISAPVASRSNYRNWWDFYPEQGTVYHVSSDMPSPTELAALDQTKNERKKFRNARKEYFEQMHRAAPGVNWREIDDRTRARKARERLDRRKELIENDALSGDLPFIEEISATDIQGFWNERGSDNLSGRMHTCDVVPETGIIYGGSSGGNIWVGSLADTNWYSINDYLQFSDIRAVIALPKAGGTRVVVVQGKVVYYTDNNGLTWETSAGFNHNKNMYRGIIVRDVTNTIYVMADGYLYKSTDDAEHFTLIKTFSESQSHLDIWTPRYGTKSVYLLNRSSIFELNPDNSLSSISTFSTSFPFNSDVRRTLLSGCILPSVTNLAVMYRVNSTSYFYGSDNGGNNWTFRSTTNEGPFMVNSFTCSSKIPGYLFFGGMQAYRSYDGGRNWQQVNSWGSYYGNMEFKLHADIPGINAFQDLNSNEFFLISTDGGTYVSTNSLMTVKNLSLQSLRISQYYSTYTCRHDPNFIYAGSQDQGLQRATADDGGVLGFNQLISGDYGNIVSGDGGSSFWTEYPTFAYYYPNATSGFYGIRYYFTANNQLWLPPLMADPSDPKSVFYGGGTTTSGAHLWHIKWDSGMTATEGTYDFSAGKSYNKISALACSPINPNHRYVLTTEGDFFHSSNAGASWSRNVTFHGPKGHYFYGSTIVASRKRLGIVYIGGSGYSNPSVYKSSNHGQTFTPMTNGLPDTMVFRLDISSDDRIVYAATEVGAYACFQENQWHDITGVSGPDQSYWSVDYIPTIDTARFSTYGRGIWDFVPIPEPATAFLLLFFSIPALARRSGT